jgi:hypothetical protein
VTSKDVHVDVIDGLAGIAPDVEGQAVAGRSQTLLPRDGVSRNKHLSDQLGVTLPQIGHHWNVPSRDHEHVYWCARIYIADCEYI